MLTFELEPPNESAPCKCCGGKTTSLTRFVRKDGDAYAVYYARFSDNHPNRPVVATVSLGEWGGDSKPEQRVAFALEIRSTDEQYSVGVLDADQSPWHESEFLGRTLNREEALAHPLINVVFHITDHMVVEDLPLKRYLDSPTSAA
jgi:hypothetical protein